MASHLVFASVIADVCPNMENIAINNVPSDLEPDVRCARLAAAVPRSTGLTRPSTPTPATC